MADTTDFNEGTAPDAYTIRVLIPKPDGSVLNHKLDIDQSVAKGLMSDNTLVKLDNMSLLERNMTESGTYYDYDAFRDHAQGLHSLAISDAFSSYNTLVEELDPGGNSAMSSPEIDITDPNRYNWEDISGSLKNTIDSVKRDLGEAGFETELGVATMRLESLEHSGGLVEVVNDMYENHYKALSPDVEVDRQDLTQLRVEVSEDNTVEQVMQPQ